ncbi:hypothetical protein AB0E27_31260 [Streptomyces sparsogenes]|uniref:hypothetical protein n=1 Tax=Streptomyces sparsogenes TaxID=67365 RepID=UPI0033E472C3
MSGPYINTERVSYYEVPDDYDPEGKDEKDAFQILTECVWEYVDAYSEVVVVEDVPEDERP